MKRTDKLANNLAYPAAPWDDRHRREGLRRIYEIAAETDPAVFHHSVSPGNAETMRHFRATLAGHARLDAARIDREVRRVRDLAEGKRVRETVYRVEVAKESLDVSGCRVVFLETDDYSEAQDASCMSHKPVRSVVRVRPA